MQRRLFFAALFVVTATLPAFSGTITARTSVEATRVQLRIRATRFLNMATFGAKPADVAALVDRMEQLGDNKKAFAEWIENQFRLEPTYLEPIATQMMSDDGIDPLQTNAWVQRYRHQAYWHATMAAEDQLLHRLASALLQVFVVSDHMNNGIRLDLSGKPHYFGSLHYYDTALLANTKGTYRDAMMSVTLHPIMGNYLSHLRNRKANPSIGRFPDENYAREIMQLFSIGLYELQPNGVLVKDSKGELVPTYDNEDIKAFARVFTGLTYEGHDSFWGWPDNSHASMIMWESEHDTDEKTLLNGTVLPAGQTGMQDINGAIDNLMAHPNIAPFVCRRLIQRLVKSNPSKEYLSRVSTTFVNTGGDMEAVTKAILLDDTVMDGVEFTVEKKGPGVWHIGVTNHGTEDARLNEPVLSFTQFMRAFNPQTDYPNGWFMMSDLSWNWTQRHLGSPSVFNFWLPDYQPPGDIVSYKTSPKIPNGFLTASEFALLTAVTANRTPNYYRWMANTGVSQHTLLNNSSYTLKCTLTLDFDEAIALANDPRALVDYLDITLAAGQLSDETRDNLIAALHDTTDVTARARSAILAVAVAPQRRVTH